MNERIRRNSLQLPLLAGVSMAAIAAMRPPLVRGADHDWTNGNLNNRWDAAGNWDPAQVPTTGDRALIAGGGGAFLRLTNSSIGYQANVGSIQITTDRNQNTALGGYYALEASNNASAVSTIAFGASGAGTGFFLNMGTFGNATWQSNSFYVGASAANTGTLASGTIVTSNSEVMNVQVAQQQRLNYYSKITGTGSITFDSYARAYASSGDLGELTLGFGHGPTSSTDSTASSTFSGGVVVRSGKLNLAEDSHFSGSTLIAGAAGVGPITFAAGVGTFTSNAALTGFDDRVPNWSDNALPDNSTRIVGNTINFNADVDVTGVGSANWNMNLTGAVNFDNGSARTLNVFPGTTSFQTTMSGTVTLGSGAGGFTLTKGGSGTLLLDNATINTTAGGGTIAIATGTIEYVANNATTKTYSGSFDSSGTLLTGTLVKSGAGTFEVGHIRVDTLNANDGTLAIIANGGDSGASRVSTLQNPSGTTPNVTLDLRDNDLVLTGSSYSAVTAMIKYARDGGAWDRKGLTSKAARDQSSHNGMLGTLTGAEYQSVYGSPATFDGFAVASGDVLVKYTYYGDADFNGVVSFDDYVRIDTGYNTGLHGWFNGDFDYSGTVNFDDYVLIDGAFNTQSGTRDDPRQRLIQLGQMWHFRLDGYMEYFIGAADKLGLHYTESDFYPDGRRPPTIPVPEPGALAVTGMPIGAAWRRRRPRHA